MSSEQPIPPSIPPRKRPDGSAQAHPVAAGPHVSPPTATAEPSIPAQPPAPSTPASVTSSMMRVIKNVVTGEHPRPSAASAALGGDESRPGTTKEASITASTDARPADGHPFAAPESGTDPGRTEALASASGPVRQAPGRAGPAASRPPSPAASREGVPRRVRLSISRVDPWSVMKLSFLLSVAIGIMIVIAAAVVWFALDGLAVFTKVNAMITEIVGKESPIDILQYVGFSRVVAGATVIAVIDVVLLTALSTIGAFLYNITAALVGGVTLTLTDD